MKRKGFDGEFVPAGEIIGMAHQVRTVGLRESPLLPDGDYTFVDMYCTDDLTSPNKVSSRGMLAFFNALLDEKWIAVIKRNYAAVKAQLAQKKIIKKLRTQKARHLTAIPLLSMAAIGLLPSPRK